MDLILNSNLERLEPRLRAFAEKRIGHKPVRELSDSEIKKECAVIINLAHVDSGQYKSTVTQKILDFQRDVLIGELKGKFKELTIAEIKEAFYLGIRNEFGEWFGLCAKTYHFFIKNYYEKKERAESMKAYLDIASAQVYSSLSEKKKRKILIVGIKESFNIYKENGELPMYPYPYYDFLKKQGLISWTSEQKKEMYEEARKEYSNIVNESKMSRKITATQAKSLLDNLKNNISFNNLCKKVALKKFYDACILSNIDFNSLCEEKDI